MVFLKHIILSLCFSLTLIAQEKISLEQGFINSFTAESDGQYKKACQALTKVYLADNYEINLRLGWLYYQAEEYIESKKYYGKAIQLLPYSIEAKTGITLPLAALEMWDEVLKTYQEVLTIDSKNTFALYNAGLIHYNRGQYNEAITYFKEFHNLYPTNYDAMLMHGWAALQLGQSREAKVIFKQLLRLYPLDESATKAMDILK